MKLNATLTAVNTLFMGLAFFLSPVRNFSASYINTSAVQDVKKETKPSEDLEPEILHSELLFKF